MKEKTDNKKINVFITGALGYIGSMIIESLLNREDIKTIIALDKDKLNEQIKNSPKVKFINSNTAENSWRREVRSYEPQIVIHLAWQIRELYGEKKKQWKWNVDGSLNVFDFAFSLPSVKKVVFASSAACYGASRKNKIKKRFKEEDSLREKEFLYGFEKKVVEENLSNLHKKQSGNGDSPDTYILRLGSVTGPRGRAKAKNFGLLPALSRNLPNGFFYKLVTAMVFFIPVTPRWCRQFIHEDDAVGIIEKISFNTPYSGGIYKTFNVAPPGKIVLSKDISEILGRKRIFVTPLMVRIMFFFTRHLSRGKITTPKGAWRSYSYPIVLDSSKSIEELGWQYGWSPREALEKNEGKYSLN